MGGQGGRVRGYRGGQAKAGQGGGDAPVGPQEAPDALQAVLGRGHQAWPRDSPHPSTGERRCHQGKTGLMELPPGAKGPAASLPRLPLRCLCWVTGLAPRAGQVSVPLGPTPSTHRARHSASGRGGQRNSCRRGGVRGLWSAPASWATQASSASPEHGTHPGCLSRKREVMSHL